MRPSRGLGIMETCIKVHVNMYTFKTYSCITLFMYSKVELSHRYVVGKTMLHTDYCNISDYVLRRLYNH